MGNFTRRILVPPVPSFTSAELVKESARRRNGLRWTHVAL